MSDTKDQNNTSDAAADKGKGKAVEQPDISMDEDSSDEESAAEDQAPEVEEDDEGMEAINTENIISDGRRTRGKNIDFVKAAQEAGDEDDEDEDDEDFEDPEDKEDKDAMQE